MLYFAWVDANEAWNASLHALEDEALLQVDLQQLEGKPAQLQILVRNPGQGLLNPARKTRAFLSHQGAGQSVPVLMFVGRVIAVAQVDGSELVRITLTALPNDAAALLQSFSAGLKVAPYWDDLFVSPSRRDDPDEVLKARDAVYCWDKLTNTVSLSGLFVGNQSLNLGQNFFYDSLQQELAETPLSAVEMTVVAEWAQQARGITDVTRRIERAFGGQKINSLTGQDLAARWPSAAKLINRQSGYQVDQAQLQEYVPPAGAASVYPTASVPVEVGVEEYPYPAGVTKPAGNSRPLFVKRWWFNAKLVLSWHYRQKRREELLFRLNHAVQAVAPSGGAVQKIAVTMQELLLDTATPTWGAGYSYQLGDQVRFGAFVYQCLLVHSASNSFASDLAALKWKQLAADASALGAGWRSSFFVTSRGQQAVQHAIERARAALARSLRAVQITVQARWEDLQGVSLDHSLTISDQRLPGGTATGKVVGLRFYADGDKGQAWAEVTMACAVGTGAAQPTPAAGSGSYTADGYDSLGWQPRQNGQLASVSGIVYNDDFAGQLSPQGLLYPTQLDALDLVRKVTVVNDADQQNAYLLANQYPQRRNLQAVVNEKKTSIKLELLDLTADDQLRQQITLTIPNAWSGPKQIEL
jgi:hypothetical protein